MASPNDMCNLIINYLPQSLTDQEFYELFSVVGKTTSTRIIRDKQTNYSFGYGFVSYEKQEDAAKAIEQLNGHALQHKKIKVAYSQPSGAQTKHINLHVSGLPIDATDDALRQVFTPYGSIVQCRVVRDRSTAQGQGFGFVLYSSRDEAMTAMRSVNGSLYPDTKDNILTVKFAKTEQKGPPQSFVRKMGQANYAYNNGFMGGMGARGGGAMRGRGGGPMRGHSFLGRYSPMTAAGTYPTVYPGLSGAGDAKYQAPTKETIVFVYGIGPETDENQLWQMFSDYGSIVAGFDSQPGHAKSVTSEWWTDVVVTSEDPKVTFCPDFGDLKVNVIWDHNKGVGKGYGFITFASYNEAAYAIQNMNGFTYQGRTLQVSIKA